MDGNQLEKTISVKDIGEELEKNFFKSMKKKDQEKKKSA